MQLGYSAYFAIIAAVLAHRVISSHIQSKKTEFYYVRIFWFVLNKAQPLMHCFIHIKKAAASISYYHSNMDVLRKESTSR